MGKERLPTGLSRLHAFLWLPDEHLARLGTEVPACLRGQEGQGLSSQIPNKPQLTLPLSRLQSLSSGMFRALGESANDSPKAVRTSVPEGKGHLDRQSGTSACQGLPPSRLEHYGVFYQTGGGDRGGEGCSLSLSSDRKFLK